MKVAFNRSEETTGMFRKKKEYVLKYRAELTPEERAVVDDPATGEKRLYEYYNGYLKGPAYYTVKIACRPEGGSHKFDGMADLIAQENEIRTQFKALADHIRMLAEQGGLGEDVVEF